MDEDNKRVVKYVYKKPCYEREGEEIPPSLIVEYLSKSKVSEEERNRLRSQLDYYFNNIYNGKKDSIINIVKNIRKITNDLSERILDVTILGMKSGVYANYRNGHVKASGAYINDWDDEVHVYTNNDKVEVLFKKYNTQIRSKEDINAINNELNELYNIVLTLNNMTKENKKFENNKIKSNNNLDTWSNIMNKDLFVALLNIRNILMEQYNLSEEEATVCIFSYRDYLIFNNSEAVEIFLHTDCRTWAKKMYDKYNQYKLKK